MKAAWPKLVQAIERLTATLLPVVVGASRERDRRGMVALIYMVMLQRTIKAGRPRRASWLNLLQWNARDARAFGRGFMLRHLAAWRGRDRHSWHLRGVGDVTVRLQSSDIDVMRQVFQWREYDLTRWPQYTKLRARYDVLLSRGERPVIIDAGANIGASALWFGREFPEAAVLSVEPDPANAEILRLNTAGHANIVLHQAAIGSAGGNIAIENPGDAAWGLRTVRSDAPNGIGIVTIPELVASVSNGRLFLVKIDIEGFEQDLFANNLDWIGEAAAILIEPHDWLLPDRGTSFGLQRAMGDQRFEMVLSGENLVYFNSTDPGVV